jgi:subtilisin family serine protease
MACKFLDSTGNGYNSDAISCIEFARTNGANIINLSWGGPDYSDAVSNALWFARRDGIVVVAAAGNNAGNTDLIPFYPAGIRLDNIVAAGASTRLDGVWLFSNYGVASVDLFAPGAAIYSTANTGDSAYVSQDGSSMASACVAGACALLRAQEPGLPPTGLIGRLLAAVDKKPAFANKCASGGRLNLRRALDRPTITALPNAQPFELLITGVPEHSYVIEVSTNLATWSVMRTNRTDALGAWTFSDPASANQPLRFYRAGPGP